MSSAFWIEDRLNWNMSLPCETPGEYEKESGDKWKAWQEKVLQVTKCLKEKHFHPAHSAFYDPNTGNTHINSDVMSSAIQIFCWTDATALREHLSLKWTIKTSEVIALLPWPFPLLFFATPLSCHAGTLDVNISLAKCCSTHLMDLSSSSSSMENIKHGTVKCLPRAWPKNLTLESYTIEVQILSPALPPQPERQTLGRTSRSIIDIWKCL